MPPSVSSGYTGPKVSATVGIPEASVTVSPPRNTASVGSGDSESSSSLEEFFAMEEGSISKRTASLKSHPPLHTGLISSKPFQITLFIPTLGCQIHESTGLANFPSNLLN